MESLARLEIKAAGPAIDENMALVAKYNATKSFTVEADCDNWIEAAKAAGVTINKSTSRDGKNGMRDLTKRA